MTERIELLRQMMIEDPKDPFLPYALALEHMGTQNFVDATAALGVLIEKHPKYLPTYYQLGKCFEEQDMIDEAIEILKKGEVLANDQKDQKALGEIKEAIWFLADD
ncbi:MAG: tetratricopeptide (TPR) repeat protein [Litorivivens sp.]|jgi:tetratricopeptide (TPR) repeat protein